MPYNPITVLISDYRNFAGYEYGTVEYFDLDNDHTVPNNCFYNTELFVGNITSLVKEIGSTKGKAYEIVV